MKHRCFRAILIALLLISQSVALSHQIGDLADLGHEFSELQSASEPSSGSPSDLCTFHIAFDDVLGAIGTDPESIALAPRALEEAAPRNVSSVPASPITPASRGPPPLL